MILTLTYRPEAVCSSKKTAPNYNSNYFTVINGPIDGISLINQALQWQ